jgi:hypothetical protein
VTVIARTLRSVPERSASATWDLILKLIASPAGDAARRELGAVSGVACSCIADEALASDPVVVYGLGPQLRIYALYGDLAIEGDGANESPLSYAPTDGDWHMSIPCLPDDLEWVQRSLKASSSRVTARAISSTVESNSNRHEKRQAGATEEDAALAVNRDAFFRR